MEYLFDALVVLHMVGWAIVVGGYVASMRTAGLYRGVFHGALTALVAGVAAAAVWKWGMGNADAFDAKMLTKLGLTVVISVLAAVAQAQGRRGDNGTGPVTPAVKHSIGLLTLVNIVIAVFWN